jgi:hypothetical protein
MSQHPSKLCSSFNRVEYSSSAVKAGTRPKRSFFMADNPGRNPEGHSPTWWTQHPDVKAKALAAAGKSKVAVASVRLSHDQESPNRFVAYLRATGFASFALAIGAILMEEYFWWFVAFVYVGLTIAAIDCAKERTLGRSRYVWAGLFLFIIGGFSYGIVWGGVKPELKASWVVGNYADGSDVHGFLWKNGWSDLRVFVDNKEDVDLKDVDIEFKVDKGVAAVKQIGDLCSIASGNSITDVIGTDQRTGNQIHFPLGPSQHPYRILCAKIPAHIQLQIVVAIGAADYPNSTQKVRPEEVDFHARYKARMRPYDIVLKAVPSDW